MLKSIQLANAVTIVCVACYILFFIVVAMAPDLVYTYMASMALGYDFSGMEFPENLDLGLAALGLICMAASIWVFVFLTVWLYNRMVK